MTYTPRAWSGPVWRRLALGRAVVDRVAHRRTDPEWLAKAWVKARILLIDERARVLVSDGAEVPSLAFVSAQDAPDGERLFLGEDEGGPYFAVLAALPEVAGARPAALREVGAALDGYQAALLAEAVGLANWHRSYRFSPLTGAPLVVRSGGWEGEATDGSGLVWPRTNPAVIVLVNDGVAGDDGRCLLGRQAIWDPGRYSCIAGFVEPGESAEAAVLREVEEETGIDVAEVTYVASQAWPLPASLMLGFYAHADSSQVVEVDGVELEDAHWFTRADLLGRGVQPTPVLPPPVSIAYELIATWRDEDTG